MPNERCFSGDARLFRLTEGGVLFGKIRRKNEQRLFELRKIDYKARHKS